MTFEHGVVLGVAVVLVMVAWAIVRAIRKPFITIRVVDGRQFRPGQRIQFGGDVHTVIKTGRHSITFR